MAATVFRIGISSTSAIVSPHSCTGTLLIKCAGRIRRTPIFTRNQLKYSRKYIIVLKNSLPDNRGKYRIRVHSSVL